MSILYDYDPDKTEGDVPSPCVGICRMDEQTALCTGCFRSIEEIMQWSRADNDYKRMVWRDIKHRMFEPQS